ncbi:phosphoglycerate dehydrogenase [soil metagenome]
MDAPHPRPPSRGKILVTPRSVTRDGHPALERLREAGFEVVLGPPGRQPSEADLLQLLPGCVGYLAGVEPVTAAALGQATHLRAISRNGTGTDNIDLEAAEAQGIQILRAAGANARGVAELAWALILGLARAVPASDAALKRGEWQRQPGLELEGRTLGIIGCGTIGRVVAGFGTAFGMRVLGFDPFPSESGIRLVDLPTLWRESDVVTLHCPPPEHGPLVDGSALDQMRDGLLLVNTARAELVEDNALLAALGSGRLGGYAADVFRHEPPGDDPLARHPKVIATPHVGGFTPESITRAVTVAVDQLLEALGGEL